MPTMEPALSPIDDELEPARPRRKLLQLGMLAKATVAMLGVGLVPLILFGAITLIQQVTGSARRRVSR